MRLIHYYSKAFKIRKAAFIYGQLFLILTIGVIGCKKIESSPFELGVGVADITPPVGYWRYGYPPVKSTGIKDSLYAKALVFKQGDEQGALLICNLLGIPRDLSRIIREQVSKEAGIPFQNITVSATHTHTSPAITEEFQKFIDNEVNGILVDSDETSYFRYLINGMTKAVMDASENRKAVKMISGIGQAPGLSFNRRYLMTDGKVRFNPGRLNPKTVLPAGPVDPDVHFVLFTSEDGLCFNTSLTVFASHYVRGGTEFSSDYPYYLEENLKDAFGENFVSVFGLGPCGNINTVNLKDSTIENADRKVEKMGNTLAEVVKNADIKKKMSRPDFKVLSKVIYLPLQDYSQEELLWSKEGGTSLYPESSFFEQRRKLKISVWGVQPPLEQLRLKEAIPPSFFGDPWRLPVEIHVFKLDKQTAIVTMPGELFTEFGIELKKMSPFENTMLIELANADIAYVPTIQAFQEGSYEAINSRLAPGSGERMVEEALIMLHQLSK